MKEQKPYAIQRKSPNYWVVVKIIHSDIEDENGLKTVEARLITPSLPWAVANYIWRMLAGNKLNEIKDDIVKFGYFENCILDDENVWNLIEEDYKK